MPSFTDTTSNALTLLMFAVLGTLMVRRVVIIHVRSLSSRWVEAMLVVVLLPFVTGFMAFHRIGYYPTIIVLHVLSAMILTLCLAWSGLGHMLFIVFARRS